jgi:hypothetical protein
MLAEGPIFGLLDAPAPDQTRGRRRVLLNGIGYLGGLYPVSGDSRRRELDSSLNLPLPVTSGPEVLDGVLRVELEQTGKVFMEIR